MIRLQRGLTTLAVLLLLVAGALVLAYNLGVTQVREPFNSFWASIPDAPEEKRLVGLIVGGVMAFFGFFGLVPLPNLGPKRSITFFGERGNITVELDSTYRTVYRILKRMPEVRSCSLDIHPSADGKHMTVKAAARLNKIPGQRARAIAARVSAYIADTAMNYLGLENVVSVDLNVQDFTIDVPGACRELAERHAATDESVFAAPAARPAPAEVRMEPVQEARPETPEVVPFTELEDLPDAEPVEAPPSEMPAGAEPGENETTTRDPWSF